MGESLSDSQMLLFIWDVQGRHDRFAIINPRSSGGGKGKQKILQKEQLSGTNFHEAVLLNVFSQRFQLRKKAAPPKKTKPEPCQTGSEWDAAT
jgi:hypothetical protein